MSLPRRVYCWCRERRGEGRGRGGSARGDVGLLAFQSTAEGGRGERGRGRKEARVSLESKEGLLQQGKSGGRKTNGVPSDGEKSQQGLLHASLLRRS